MPRLRQFLGRGRLVDADLSGYPLPVRVLGDHGLDCRVLQTDWLIAVSARLTHSYRNMEQPMTTLNLNSLTLPELKQLQKDVDKAVAGFEDRKKSEARTLLEGQAKELGYTC